MKHVQLFTRRANLAMAAAASIVTACAVWGPRAERWRAPTAGASWEVAQSNTGSYGKDMVLRITRGDGIWQGQPVMTLANSQGMNTVITPTGHWIAIVGRDGRTLTRWDPPLGFEYPITVGKSWVKAYRMTFGAQGKTLPYDLNCTVQSHEKVTVRAGTLDAFKIVCSTNIGNEETYWINFDQGVFIKTDLRRTTKSPFGAGTQQSELVLAPSLKP